MGRMSWATYLWPGLTQLWHGGSVAGLALAGGFAVLVNLLLLCSFVWEQLLSPWHVGLGWAAIGMVWMASAVVTAWQGRRAAPLAEVASAEGLFREALGEYLQKSWFEAERILGDLLRLCPRDVEARLLLATLLRRTGRSREALDELGRIELVRDAEKWSWEIAAERQLLAEPQAGPLADDRVAAHDNPAQPFSHQAA